MSQRDGFTSGFLAGTIVGGLIGGIVGAIVASGRASEGDNSDASLLNSSSSEAKAAKAKKRQLKLKDSESIEVARRSLEDKIAQLNSAIDDVRMQLGAVNGNAVGTDSERSTAQDS